MLLSMRSRVLQLCLLIFALVAAVTWYRDYIDATRRAWEERLRSQVHSNATLQLEDITPEPVQPSAGPRVRLDGLLETDMTGLHPLWDLLEHGERQWEDMLERQSTTLAAAVAEYERRNGYAPPAGFDLWWDFVQKHNVKLVDEFDQINYDITPYLALSPVKFRERVKELDDPTVGHHVNITNGNTGVYGPQQRGGFQRQLASMIMGFSRALPDLVVHGHREMRTDLWIGEDLRRAAQRKAAAGEYFTDEELQHFESLGRNPHTDRKNMCMQDDPVFNLKHSYSPNKPTFIASHLTAMSPCSNPLLHHTAPFIFHPNPGVPRLTPHFVFSKHRPDSGLLLPSNLFQYFDPLLEKPHTWEERHGGEMEKVLWQGRSTGWNWGKWMGTHEPGITWRNGARPKFVLEFGANATEGEHVEVLVEMGSRGGLAMKTFDRKVLNEKWMDVSMLESPAQCNESDGTCGEMNQSLTWKEAYTVRQKNMRKFVVDLDSNSWSDEFQRKLSWGNVVLKATTYPEWNTQWLIPYYHYIPIQTDYSDVYNILAFFLGDPQTGTGGHDDIAKRISQRASAFVREYWRWEDMQAYLYRLMLEYARLGSDDREAASFRL